MKKSATEPESDPAIVVEDVTIVDYLPCKYDEEMA